MLDVIYVVFMFILLIAPFALAKLWYWVILTGCIALLTGIMELIALKKTGKTLSQQFFAYVKVNKKKAALIIFTITVAWVMLIVHLFFNIPGTW